MKKVLSVLLCVVMLFSVVAVSAFAVDDAPLEVAPLHICPNHKAAFPALEEGIVVTDTYLLIKTADSEGFVHYESDFVFDESFDGAVLKFAYAVEDGVVESDAFVLEVCHEAVEPYHYDDLYHWNVCSLCGDPYGKELHSYLIGEDEETGDEALSHVCDGCGIEEPTDGFANAAEVSNIFELIISTFYALIELIMGLF